MRAKYLLILLLPVVGFCLASASVSHKNPLFNDDYYVEGVIMLPYAEIKEPFIGYYDAANNRSRVDYYGDLVLTVQMGDATANGAIGVSYKLAWMVDSKGNPQRVCFAVNGTKEAPVAPQSVLPDLSPFQYIGNDACPNTLGLRKKGSQCERYENVEQYGDKQNKYIFWLQKDGNGSPVPVHFTMKGYDALLGSHYDHYEISYKNYKEGGVTEDVFHVADNFTCRGFPGPGAQHVGIHNPIKEFVNNHVEHIDQEFEDFKTKHSKTYRDKTHHAQRKTIFRHNYRYIQSKNRQKLHYSLAVNQLADYTNDELRYLRGRIPSKGPNGGQPFHKHRFNESIPDQWDWRLYGAVNPVKDQAVCGSCWSFGTTGTIEGVYFVKTGHLVRLSEQQLIDCSWNEGDNGCDGGEDFRAYNYIMKVGGLSLDEDYGGYLGQDGKCHDKQVKKQIKLKGFVNVTHNDPEALEVAIFQNGPVTVGIDASHKTFSFYDNGVYYDPECGNTPESLDHQVLAVGYGTLLGQRYWLIKNSWSTYWGNDGYVLMSQKDNNCGVMTSPTFPVIE